MKISIITATYNSSQYLLDNIRSVANQTYKNVEHIIVDNMSTDDTIQILNDFNFDKNNIIYEKDTGIYQALNKGIKKSSGEIIGILNSDDLFENNRILEIIAENFLVDSIDAVYGNLKYVNKKNNKIIRDWKSNIFNRSDLRYGWMPPHPSIFIKRKIIYPNNMYNEKFKISADYELILRIFSKKDFNAKFINNYFVRMRIGGKSNNSLQNIFLKIYEDYLSLNTLNINPLRKSLCLVLKNLSKLKQFTFIHS
jgi:glycosyltransferase